jgi:mRNA-degrading endonuclease toxin of MazEF toxin-antitoxin module
MPRRGEVWRRGDVNAYVVVLSNDLYHQAGSYAICAPVFRGNPSDHHPAVIPLTTPISGHIIPAFVVGIPQSALSERIGMADLEAVTRSVNVITAAITPASYR